jgi:putative transposase
MPRTRRLVVPDVVHHVVARGVNGTRLFRHGYDKRRYLQRAAILASEEQVLVHGYCLMDNHVHLLLTPTRPQSLARFFSRLHTWWSMVHNRNLGRTGHLFQCRYFSSPLSECYYWNALRYVELNPVRASLVTAPEHWPWSSARQHLALPHTPDLLLAPVPTRATTPTPADWRQLLTAAPSPQADDQLRKAQRSCRPCGPPGFLAVPVTVVASLQ